MWAIEDHTIEWGRWLLASDISESGALEHFHFRREHLQEVLDAVWERIEGAMDGI